MVEISQNFVAFSKIWTLLIYCIESCERKYVDINKNSEHDYSKEIYSTGSSRAYLGNMLKALILYFKVELKDEEEKTSSQ